MTDTSKRTITKNLSVAWAKTMYARANASNEEQYKTLSDVLEAIELAQYEIKKG